MAGKKACAHRVAIASEIKNDNAEIYIEIIFLNEKL